MSDVTTQDLVKLEERMDKRFDELQTTILGAMSEFANSVDGRFNTIEKRLDEHDEQFRILNSKYDHLINAIDGFIGRIDKYETELAARDHKIDRLERWIQQLATTSGVKLT